MKTAVILVKQGALRSQPSFIGTIISNIQYGTRVEIIQETAGWAKIRLLKYGLSGWMHTSALTKNGVVLKSGSMSSNSTATGDELALAGKGFNNQVERQFKSKNPGLDFTWVNRMENYQVSDMQIRQFLMEGKLPSGGGLS